MRIHQNYIPPIGIGKKVPVDKKATGKPISPFQSHLQEAINSNQKLHISKHAKIRMEERNIQISKENWDTITSKVSEARKMGVNESLVLIDNAALIVSAKNQTVITAMDKNEAKSQIFSNISGAIII